MFFEKHFTVFRLSIVFRSENLPCLFHVVLHVLKRVNGILRIRQQLTHRFQRGAMMNVPHVTIPGLVIPRSHQDGQTSFSSSASIGQKSVQVLLAKILSDHRQEIRLGYAFHAHIQAAHKPSKSTHAGTGGV